MVYYDEQQSAYSRDYKETGTRVGLAFIGLAGLSSAVSTLALLVYITQYAFFSKDENNPLVRGLRSFSRSALGAFLYSLLISDFIQGAAFAVNFKWAADSGMRHSVACTAQGAVSQIGDLGGALWSLAIAYYTFSLLFLLKKPPVWVTRCCLGVGWTLIFLLPILGPTVIQNVDKRGHFYGISGAWCWIGDGYQVERFIYVYMWIFLSLLSSLVLYGLVYLRFSGLLYYEHGRLIWKKSESGLGLGCLVPWAMHDTTTSLFMFQENPASEESRKETHAVPLVSVLGRDSARGHLSARRHIWLECSSPLYIFSGITFSSSGLTNVILFIATRHSFIQRVAAIQPRIHIVTQQVTVLEDARGPKRSIFTTCPQADPKIMMESAKK
ncbi:G protein coupled glucose receptor regulating Gpa2 protein [Ceratobasidium sp. AG-Ba]|nr:G protein coupled glucose receptor regulating Gpa2 protein [Ceratobasidium sp. AG-Ba]